MARFRFAFTEVSTGYIEVWADSEDEAREKAETYEGDMFVKDSNLVLRECIEKEGK